MPPYQLLTWTELGTNITLVQLLQAHLVCDEVDVIQGRDRSRQALMLRDVLVAVLCGTG